MTWDRAPIPSRAGCRGRDASIVTYEPSDADFDVLGLLTRLVVRSRDPVLVIPSSFVGFEVGGKALIAWDGSSAAYAAVQAAIPLLAGASSVVILEIDEPSGEGPRIMIEQAKACLERSKIKAVVQHRSLDRPISVAQSLCAASARISADYIVMGAFGRARYMDAVLGSVTRETVASAKLPVFLAY